MKVLHLSSARGWAGGEAHVVVLGRHLAERGVATTLACRPGSPIGKAFLELGLPVIDLALGGAADLVSMARLARFCKREQIDVVHAHPARDYWLAVGARLLSPGPRVVVTRHLVSKRRDPIAHALLYRRIDRVIAVSRAVGESLVRVMSVPSSKIAVIPNGIDTRRYADAASGRLRRELAVESTVPLVGMVGTVSPHKGQQVFLRALPRVRERFPGCVGVIAGGDREGGRYIEALRAMARDLGLGDSVRFLGARPDVPEVLKDLTVFVLASVEEPFGLVLVEAMAAGVPVVATDAGGPCEIVADEETGLLVESGNVEALGAGIARLLGDPALARRFAAAGQRRAIERFDAAVMADRTLDLYRMVLAGE